MATDSDNKKDDPAGWQPFRKAVFRGLGILLPPLLTILIFAWVIAMTHRYVLDPVTRAARGTLVRVIRDTRQDLRTDTGDATATVDGRVYRRIQDDTFIPKDIYDTVRSNPGDPPPVTARGYYERYVNLTYLRPWLSIPFFLLIFVFLLYLLGRFMAAGIGRFSLNLFERVLLRLPLIRTVYSSVKQVSDFLFTDREIEYSRVVAVEYPRKGIWSLGMVTGESLLDIRSAANEAVLSVLIPTSPMPVTGYTVTVLKSETIDLNVTIDQAFQFVVSCGVLVPPQQLQELLERKLLEDRKASGDGSEKPAETAGEPEPLEDSEPAESKK